MTAEDSLPAVPSGYLRFCYMVGQDQEELREQLWHEKRATIDRSYKAIKRSGVPP